MRQVAPALLVTMTRALVLAGFASPMYVWGEVAVVGPRDMVPLGERPTLFGGPNSPEEWLRDHGLGLDISLTQFGQAMPAPSEGDNHLQYGGKLNAIFALDGAKLGLWEGLSTSAIIEYKYGHSVNGFNGVLLPINTQLYVPASRDSAVSLTFSQRFGKDLALTIGKFNMVQAAAATPIVGGGGINTFWNLNFAAPPSGLVPPYITGLSLNANTELANFTLMIFDPKDSQNGTGLSGWGQNGINTRLSVRFPVKIAGREGYQTLVGVYSTQDKIDLADLPWLVLPSAPSGTIDVKHNSWYVGWNFQQYLWQSPTHPGEGWGLFGQAFVADGNPNQYR